MGIHVVKFFNELYLEPFFKVFLYKWPYVLFFSYFLHFFLKFLSIEIGLNIWMVNGE